MEVIGYENYLIYPEGNVYSKYSKRYLKPCNDKDGYKYVGLKKDGKRKIFKIHRLVALHYIPNDENKPQVDHINRDKSDNRIENLRWVTNSENSQNKGIPITNTSGIKNISLEGKSSYRYIKVFRGKHFSKRFKTLEEAIQFKKQYESGKSSGQKPLR